MPPKATLVVPLYRSAALIGPLVAGFEEAADRVAAWDLELVAIDDETYAAILARDEVARRHRSLLDHLRANRRYLLEETV